MSDDILVKQDGPILRITLNAPDRGNAVTDDNVRELTRLINGAGEKADMVVLRGAGKEFCVGRAGMGSRPATEEERRPLSRSCAGTELLCRRRGKRRSNMWRKPASI